MSLAATLLLMAAAASVAFGHGGHPHTVHGPPAPDSLWPGAPAAHDALEQARFQRQLADAPLEVHGACATTAPFDGIGRGCRTDDGLLRVELAGGGEMLTHGPDFVGAASDLTPSTTTPTIVAAVQNASKSDVSCVPTSEAHTQLVYAIPADGVDQSATKSAAFRQSTYEASAVIDNTSRLLSATAGRRLRVACDGAGDATVLTMRLPRRAAASNFSSVHTDVEAEYAKLSNVGSATKVRYLVYYDTHLDGFSGIGSLYPDTTAGAANNNNLAEAMAVQDNSNGDGPDWYVLLHEISHNMGAVQDGAPDSNEVSHCNDGLDVMCYAEPGTGGVSGTYTTTTCVELRYDCDSDSYFHPAPTTPWLQVNWNVAATYNRYLDAYTATADTTAPATPTGLAGIGHGDFIRLTWNPVADADLHTYRIERDTGGGVWRTVGDAWLGETTFDATWSGIAANTSYSLRVRAYDEGGRTSAESAPILVNTGATDADSVTVGGPALAPPINAVVESTTDASITLRWDAPQMSGATGWEVDKEWGTDWWRSQYGFGSASGSVTFNRDVYDALLLPGTRYQYRIRLTDDWGRTSASVTVAGWTKTAPDVTAPSAPGNLQVASSAGTTPTLTWATVAEAVDYVVSRESTPGSGTWSQLAIVTSPTYTVSGLAHGTTHSLSVEARDEAGNVSNRSTTSFVAPAAGDMSAPTAPTINGTSFSITHTTIGYSWSGATDDVGVIGYRMLYRPSSTQDYQLGPTTTGTSGTITGLVPGTDYVVIVEAYDAAGHATMSGGYVPRTTADTTAPTQPSSLTASAHTSTSMQLDWGASTDAGSGVSGYRVYRTNPGGEQLLTTTAAGVRTYTPTGLTPDTSYTFAVEAIDAAANASTRSTATSSTSPAPDPTPPSTPATFTQGPGPLTETTAPVQWTAATDNVAVVAYDIYRTAPTASVTPVMTLGAVTSTTLTALTHSTAYSFEIAARDAAGNVSLTRQPLSFTTPDLTAPAVPANVRTTARTGTSITLAWDVSNDNVLTAGYRIYQVVGAVDTLVATVPSGTTYTVSALADATDYTFRIEAYDASANTSTRASHTTYTSDTQTPTQPGALQLGTVTGTSIAFSWTASTDARSPITYELRDGSATGTILASTTSLGATITDLDDGVTHHVFLVARDPSNNTSPARDLQVATPDITDPNAPTNLVASNVGGTTFDLDWTHATDNVGVDHYRVLVDDVEVASPSLNEVTVSGRDDATTHGVDVIAVDAAGRESAATSIDVTTLDATAPGAPGAFTASAATDTTISMTWTLATDNVAVTGYRIYQMSPGTPDTLIASPSALATSATVSGLTASTSYTFEIAAHDARGLESTRASVSRATLAAPDLTPPTQPSFLPADNVTTGGMRLAWTASTDLGGIAGYDLERLIGATWTLVTPRMPLLQFDVTGLAPGTSHSFRVRAVDASGNASTYATTSVATDAGPDLAAPAIPSGPVTSAADTSGTVTLTWGASTDDRGVVAGYRVSLLTGAGYILQTVATTNTVILTGQPIGTTATYAIAAIDPAGNTSTALVTTVAIPAPAPPPPPMPEPPAAAVPASAFAATVTSTQITLSWQQGGTATTGWRIVEIRSGAVASTRDVGTSTSRYGPYAPNTSVRFELYSLAGGATSSAVTLDVKTAADTVKPTKPGRFRVVSPAGGTFALTWTRSRDDVRLRGYEVKLTTRGVKPKVVKLGATALKAKVIKLRPRAPYVVQIRAVDMAGNASVWVTVRLRTR